MKDLDTLILEKYDSHAAFAKAIGVSDRVLFNYRTGRVPPIAVIEKMAECLKQTKFIIFEIISKKKEESSK